MIPYSDADVQHRTFPIVNVLLISVSTLVFLYELQLGGGSLLRGGGNLDSLVFFLKWGFIPGELTSGNAYTSLGNDIASLNISTPVPTWATIFSSMFIHGGILHFAGNMMFLWVFGDNVEDWLGHLKYLIFYLIAGVAAALSQLAINPDSTTPMIGASGAISGVMGAYMLLYPYNRIKALIIFYFITVIQLPAILLLGLWFAWQLVQGLGSLAIPDQVSVAFFAHIGGFVAGVVLAALYKLLTGQPVWPRRTRNPWDSWYRTRRNPD